MKKVFFVLFFLILFALPINITFAQSGLADSPCPMFKCNLKHNGQTSVTTDIEKPNLKWKFDAGNGIETSPTIGADGTIYFGSFKDNFYALNPDGSVKWKLERPGEEFRSTPTIARDGTIYFGAVYDTELVYNKLHDTEMDYGIPKVYALNPDGSVKWEFVTGGILGGTYASPTIGPDGTIYMGAGGAKMTERAVGGDRLWAINPDGTEKWHFNTEEAIFTAVAIADDGTIYLAGAEGVFYAINSDGTEKWRFEKRDGYFDASPTIDKDGTIYFGSTNKNLYALTKDGEEKWSFKVNDILEAPVSIGLDGTLYSGVIDMSKTDKNLYALNPDGTEKWRFETGDGVFATPTIDANGILYFGSYDGHLYSFNPDGTERWRYKTDGGITYSPTISKDNTIYFGSWDNHLYAIGGAAPKEEEQPEEIVSGESERDNRIIYYLVGAAILVILLVAAILLIRMKKKSQRLNEKE